jgi:hypothetical protein
MFRTMSPHAKLRFYVISIYKIHNFKSKRICNPERNGFLKIGGDVTISEDGLVASMNTNTNGWRNAYADKGFPISVVECRADDFPGTICYYFEVKSHSQSKWCVILLI